MSRQERDLDQVDKSQNHRHYSEVGGHQASGAFARHKKAEEKAFGMNMRGVPPDYDDGWHKRRFTKRISQDGKR